MCYILRAHLTKNYRNMLFPSCLCVQFSYCHDMCPFSLCVCLAIPTQASCHIHSICRKLLTAITYLAFSNKLSVHTMVVLVATYQHHQIAFTTSYGRRQLKEQLFCRALLDLSPMYYHAYNYTEQT